MKGEGVFSVFSENTQILCQWAEEPKLMTAIFFFSTKGNV